jgi:5-methylcytosine-specific restriction protein A
MIQESQQSIEFANDGMVTNRSSEIPIKPGDIIDNNELRNVFRVGSQGGMRRSLRTNTLVIISDHTKAIYEDRWIGDIFHYTGMGLSGDQRLDFMQNKTLTESHTNGVNVHLFEVFDSGRYTYHGEVFLAGEPYLEKQPDVQGNLRDVYVFPLKLKSTSKIPPISQEVLKKKGEEQQKIARRLTDAELEKRARYSRKGVGSREVSTKTYERNPYVIEYAKRRARGICQLCGNPAPFMDKVGLPFLETHHIEWLSNGGEDTIENTVALCPNCHRKMHILDSDQDKDNLKGKIR